MWGKYMKAFVELVIFLCTGFFFVGCAKSSEMPKRPWPSDSDFFFLPSLTYIYPTSVTQVYQTVLNVLSENKFTFVEDRNERVLRDIGRYSKISANLTYEESGKKYRKQCEISIFFIQGYPDYTNVHLMCFWDVYEFGFGRGGPHNLWNIFKWKKDWYPEPGAIFIVEDMLEMIREKLGLKTDEVIRPRDFVSREAATSFIIKYEADRAIKEGATKEILFYSDREPYQQNKWNMVETPSDKTKFEQSPYKAWNYLYKGRLIKTVISAEIKKNELAYRWEYYFHKNGNVGYLNEYHVVNELRTPEEYKEYFLEWVKKHKPVGVDTKRLNKELETLKKRWKEIPLGPYAVERRRIFAEDGKENELLLLEKAYVLTTKEDVNIDYIKIDLDAQIFKNIKSLPFIKMIESEQMSSSH